MTDANRESGSAFPVVERVGGSIAGVSSHLDCTDPGLTKRELFAAMAMQGWLANPAIDNQSPVELPPDALIAKMSVLVADALIAELGRERAAEKPAAVRGA